MNALITAYAHFKTTLGDHGFTEELLHLHAGLLIFFASALVFRRRMRSLVPISLVYVLAVTNEAVDLLTPGSSTSLWEPVFDILKGSIAAGPLSACKWVASRHTRHQAATLWSLTDDHTSIETPITISAMANHPNVAASPDSL